MRDRQAMTLLNRFGPMDAEPADRALRPGRWVTVFEWEQGLLFRHGRLHTVLAPGRYRWWSNGLALRTVDTRPWVLALPTQEVPTADGATVKLTVAGQAKVTDATAYVTATRKAEQALYLAVQVALRELAAGLSVADLLTGRRGLGERLLAGLGDLAGIGIGVDKLEIKDIILPGELKKAQAEVLVARAQGLASLERARGETAALRSLANAARMAADNPALVQLRLLQQLEASAGHTVVIGTPPLGASPAVPGAAPPKPARLPARPHG
jgi:regulator of protease activity HflC (stomatin/prohibitin superfamily)